MRRGDRDTNADFFHFYVESVPRSTRSNDRQSKDSKTRARPHLGGGRVAHKKNRIFLDGWMEGQTAVTTSKIENVPLVAILF